MQNISDIFDSFGGTKKLAGIMGVAIQTAGAWKARGSIPVDYWPSFIRHSAENGTGEVTAELLLRCHAEPVTVPA